MEETEWSTPEVCRNVVRVTTVGELRRPFGALTRQEILDPVVPFHCTTGYHPVVPPGLGWLDVSVVFLWWWLTADIGRWMLEVERFAPEGHRMLAGCAA